jgi:CubicO group peptidase (beta-lactamase class C family)
MDMDLPTTEEMKERLDTWAARYYVAGASLGVMHGDDVRVVATGVINKNTGVEVTPGTLFQMGSITKLYTTTLIMQLIDEGRLELDAPAVTYLPDLRFGDEGETRRVTLRHLLTHTSGVDGDFFDDFGRGDDAVAKYVEACAKLPFVFPVGSMWSYCNAGFVVLGRIIEIITGGTWDAALRTRLLDPLGVKQTVTLPEEALLHNTAAGHFVAPSLEISLAPAWGMARCAAPAGATPCTTVADLLTFAKMHADGGTAADGKRLLSETSVRAMQESQFDLPVVPGPGAAHWGLGWMLFDWGGRRVIGHDGGTIGQIASLRALPEERFGVALLTNSSPTGGLLANRVIYWLFGQHLGIEMPERPTPPESPPEIDVRPYVGVYERLGLRINIAERDGVLSATYTSTGPLADMQPELPPMDLVPVERALFVERNPYLGTFEPVTFSGFENGRPRYFFSGRVARRVD